MWVIAPRWLVGAHRHQQDGNSEQGAVRERTDGVAPARCTSSAGRFVYDERAATRPFLGAHPVQLELPVRATLCDQCVASLDASSGAL